MPQSSFLLIRVLSCLNLSWAKYVVSLTMEMAIVVVAVVDVATNGSFVVCAL